jgi:hypothetical protein
MPATIALTFDDGTTQQLKLPVEMWNLGDQFIYRVPGTKQPRRVEIDPARALPDVDRANNVWPH